jgi:hypothetical protein
MEVKGTAVVVTPVFIKEKFGLEKYDFWFNTLPEESKKIFSDPIVQSLWYPLKEAFVIPTQKLCELFYAGELKGAWELGRFSADYALKGVYRLFVKFGSPYFIIKRASKIFSTYYRPSEMKVIESSQNRVIARILKFPDPSKYVEYRIGGWIERAFEISGAKDVKIRFTSSLTDGAPYTELTGEWK